MSQKIHAMAYRDSDQLDGILSLVIPTSNRSAQVLDKLKWANTQPIIGQVVIIVDGYDEQTVTLIEDFSAKAKFVLNYQVNEFNIGASASRNLGVQLVTNEFILFSDDDDFFETNFCVALMSEMVQLNADVVGAAWLNLDSLGYPPAHHKYHGSGPTLNNPSIIPASTVICPFLPMNFICKTEVARLFPFSTSYLINGYREETDFFITLLKNKFSVFCSPKSFSYSLGRPTGGYERKGIKKRLTYETFAVLNNGTFLIKHGAWLYKNDYIRNPFVEFTLFTFNRIKNLALHLKR